MRRTPMTTAATKMIPRTVDVAIDISDPRSLAGSCSPPPSLLPPGGPAPGHLPPTEPGPPPPPPGPAKALDPHWVGLQSSPEIRCPVQLPGGADRRTPPSP